jgi:3-hydroxyacyl-CoA dehydrogenase/enoyl-CoA hydratase/3-hydroxybutyryl-CoA epimerase
MTQTIRYAVDADGIAQLVIDVPDRPMNVMTPEFLGELGECVARIAGDAGVRGAVISSAKTSFMAGADIKDMVGMIDRGVTAQQATDFSTMLTTHYRRLETVASPSRPRSTVSLRQGRLALVCHYQCSPTIPRQRSVSPVRSGCSRCRRHAAFAALGRRGGAQAATEAASRCREP